MKPTKKHIITAFIAALTLGCIGGSAITANASEKSNTIVKDDFSNRTYLDTVDTTQWEVFGENVKQSKGQNSTIKFLKKQSDGGVAAAVTSEKYAMTSLQFDYYTSDTLSSWIGLNILSDVSAKIPTIYGSPILFTHTDLSPNGVKIDGQNKIFQILGESNTGKKYRGEWFTVRYEFDAENAGKFDLYFARQGEELKKAITVTANAANKVFNEGYIRLGLNSSADGYLEYDNFIIKTTDGKTITEDFENGLGIFELRGKGIIVDTGASLGFNDAAEGERVITKSTVVGDDSILESLIGLNATVRLSVADESSRIAFLFGLSRKSTEPFARGSYAFVFDNEKIYLVKYGEDKAEEVLAEKTLESITDTDVGTKINIAFNKNGVITVTENGDDANALTYNAGSAIYAGYAGFAAASENTDAKVFEAEFVNETYFVPTTKSLTHNFSTDYLGNEENPDFFMTSTPNNTLSIKDGKLNYNGCSDGTIFAPAYTYDDFILDYKITDILVGNDDTPVDQATSKNRWIGLDIGRTSYDSTKYGSYLMFYFSINPSGKNALNAYRGNGASVPEDLTITENAAIPNELFTAIQYGATNEDGTVKDITDVKSGDAVCIRWVAENNTLKLYMKKASEKQFTLHYTVTGVETSGYIALCNTGYTFMNVDDFSIANTSNIYVCGDNDYPETIVEEVAPKYEYNKYLFDTNLNEELNYLKTSGCSGSMNSSVLFAVLGALAIVTFAKKNDKR